MSTRTYVADITTATSGLQVQMQRPGRIRQIVASLANTAVGKVEVSRSPTSLIGTAQPDPASVIFRADLNAGGNVTTLQADCDVPVTTLDRLFIHMTGAANVGTINLCVMEGGKS